MNVSSYSPEINQIIKELQQAVPEAGKRAITLLRKLQKMADEADSTLRGFICYCYASVYNTREQFEPFMRYLRRAIGFLLRTDERETLARAYNLFATEAQKNGCFDVAYNYFAVAASFLEQEEESLAFGMIEGNIGDLLMEMEEYRAAIRHIRRSYPIVNRHIENVLRPQYRVLILCNLGICTLSSGDYDEAEKTLRRIEKDTKKMDGDSIAAKAALMFRARMSLEEGNARKIEEVTDEVIREVVETPYLSELSKETLMYCDALNRARHEGATGRLLEAISRSGLVESSAYSASRFAQLEIDYHTASGDRTRAKESYTRRHAFYQRFMEVKRRFYNESVKLMLLVEELRREREEKTRENVLLQQYAETDALTGLPNRYAMTRHFEEVFETAVREGRRICIGLADIDRFKAFNDRFGHAAGDECLVRVGRELAGVAKEMNMFVARYGGDEFVFVGENVEAADLSALEREVDRRVSTDMTMGVYSLIPDESVRLWDCLAEADRRMYDRKKAGAR